MRSVEGKQLKTRGGGSSNAETPQNQAAACSHGSRCSPLPRHGCLSGSHRDRAASAGFHPALWCVRFSPSDHSVVADGFGSNTTAAETAAINNCTAKGKSDCIPVGWFGHAYGQFDVSTTKGAWGYGYASTAKSAASWALYYCKQSGGTSSSCKVAVPAVATASPSSSATGADLFGRACMVFAPLGADFGLLGTYGHVGWAFLTDRDSGTWIFGANEGGSQLNGAGGPSKTWIDKGNWSKLVNDFSSAVDYHSAAYYLFPRCSSFAGNNSLQGYNEALSLWHKTYSFPNNDCLTNAVDILKTYGATLNASDSWPSGHWAPKDYYYNELTGWEPSGYL